MFNFILSIVVFISFSISSFFIYDLSSRFSNFSSSFNSEVISLIDSEFDYIFHSFKSKLINSKEFSKSSVVADLSSSVNENSILLHSIQSKLNNTSIIPSNTPIISPVSSIVKSNSTIIVSNSDNSKHYVRLFKTNGAFLCYLKSYSISNSILSGSCVDDLKITITDFILLDKITSF
jgi:hypothetical protein